MRVTQWVVLGSCALLLGYDLFAVIQWGDAGTISDTIIAASQKSLAIPFAAGFLMGHLFAHGDIK